MPDAMTAETIRITGHGGDENEAYLNRPLDSTPHGGIVVIHHMPGYDDATSRHLVLCSAPPELHSRAVSPSWESSAVEFGNRRA